MITGAEARFKNLERKVGLFVLLAVAGLLGVVLFILVENDMLTSTYTVSLTAPKGTGFSPGMPIKLSGFRIGRVKTITLNDSAAVDVVLQIDRKYRKWMRKDSVARLIKEGMIGDYIIEISSGTSSELIPENGTIMLGKTKALDEIAEEIADKVKPVLLDIKDIIAYINKDNGDLKQILHNFNTFSRNIEGSRRKADQLLVSSNRTIDTFSGRFDVLLTKTGARLDQAEPILGKIDNSLQLVEKRLPQMLEKLDHSLDQLESVTSGLNAVSADTLPQIPRIVTKAEGVIDRSDGLLEGMKLIWPLSSVVPQTDTKSLLQRDSNE